MLAPRGEGTSHSTAAAHRGWAGASAAAAGARRRCSTSMTARTPADRDPATAHASWRPRNAAASVSPSRLTEPTRRRVGPTQSRDEPLASATPARRARRGASGVSPRGSVTSRIYGAMRRARLGARPARNAADTQQAHAGGERRAEHDREARRRRGSSPEPPPRLGQPADPQHDAVRDERDRRAAEDEHDTLAGSRMPRAPSGRIDEQDEDDPRRDDAEHRGAADPRLAGLDLGAQRRVRTDGGRRGRAGRS